MIQKKKTIPAHHYADDIVRPKKKKYKKSMLTSMTSHIKVKEPQEEEEGPEDGEMCDEDARPTEPKKAEAKRAEHNYVIANKIAVGQMPRRSGQNMSSQGNRIFNSSVPNFS